MSNCSDDFYLDDNSSTCLPQCGKWTYTSHSIDRILTIATIAGTVLGILVSTILLVVSFILYKKMWVDNKKICRYYILCCITVTVDLY